MSVPPAAFATTVPTIPADLARWRADTPGVDHRVHLNNAGAAFPPRPIHDAMVAHLERELVEGGYEAADNRAAEIADAYGAVAGILNGAARNVAILQNATLAFAQALAAFDFRPGDVILTTRDDYVSNQLAYLSLARRSGVVIERADDLPEGGVDPESIRGRIRRRRPALVAVTWVPTNSGLVQPVEAVGQVCNEAGVSYLVDACQAVGQMPVDVRRIGCDYLSATARKFLRGPRGIGFLYVSDRALDAGAYPMFVDFRGAVWTDPDRFELTPDARRFESWEFPFAGVLGLGAAARYAAAVGIETAQDRAWALAAYARERLAALPGVRILDRGAIRCAIVTMAIAGHDATELKLTLRLRGINTSSADRAVAVIDMDEKGATTLLRVSPHYYNTVEEIDRLVEELTDLLSP